MAKSKQVQAPEEGNTEPVEKVELTPEQKKEKVQNLLMKLKEAKDSKDIPAQKTLRRNLRKLGFYISKEKESMMEALIG